MVHFGVSYKRKLRFPKLSSLGGARERQRVEKLAADTVVVIAPPANFLESRLSVQGQSSITVTRLKMKAGGAAPLSHAHKASKQRASHPALLHRPADRE